MSGDLVPEEAIAAAARELTSHNYDGMGSDHQRYLRARAIRALEAAVPLILAAELRRLAEWAEAEAATTAGGFVDGMNAAAHHLRQRASVLRGEGQTK